jgi:hypothetical protein
MCSYLKEDLVDSFFVGLAEVLDLLVVVFEGFGSSGLSTSTCVVL